MEPSNIPIPKDSDDAIKSQNDFADYFIQVFDRLVDKNLLGEKLQCNKNLVPLDHATNFKYLSLDTLRRYDSRANSK